MSLEFKCKSLPHLAGNWREMIWTHVWCFKGDQMNSHRSSSLEIKWPSPKLSHNTIAATVDWRACDNCHRMRSIKFHMKVQYFCWSFNTCWWLTGIIATLPLRYTAVLYEAIIPLILAIFCYLKEIVALLLIDELSFAVCNESPESGIVELNPWPTIATW